MFRTRLEDQLDIAYLIAYALIGNINGKYFYKNDIRACVI